MEILGIMRSVKKQNINTAMIWLPLMLLGVVVITGLFPECAVAQTQDTLREHSTVVENFLTGNIMRGVAIAGNVWGLMQSYMKSSVMILSGVIGIDLIGAGMLTWVKATWAFVI